MPIAVSSGISRPKLATTTTVPVSVTVANPTEADGSDSYTQYITLSVEPDTITASCTADNADTTLTASTTTHNVRVGDVVSGTGITGGTVVTDVSGATITIDQATTQAITDETLTFNPPTTAAKLVGLVGEFSVTGSQLTLRLRGYKADGSTAAGPGGVDATAIADMGAAVMDQRINIDLDSFLTNARQARTNS